MAEDARHAQLLGLSVGDPLAPRVEPPISITDFVRYQGAADDMNPIHHDPDFARQAGYPGPFAVGMLQAGVLANYVADQYGVGNVRRFKVQFREQAWPGDVITYSATVTDVRDVDTERLVDFDLLATRQTGGVHLQGWATFAVARP